MSVYPQARPNFGQQEEQVFRDRVRQDMERAQSDISNIANLDIFRRPKALFFPQLYGAKADGVADDTVAQQAAIDAAGEVGGIVVYAPGQYRTTATLQVKLPIWIQGAGWGDDTSSASQPDVPTTNIVWDGANDVTAVVILVKSATAGNFIWNFRIDGLNINGANKAGYGLVHSTTRMNHVGSIRVARCRTAHVQYDNGNGDLSANNTFDFIFTDAGSNGACLDASGLVLKTVTTGLSLTRISGNTLHASVQSAGAGWGLIFGDIDASHIRCVYGRTLFRGLTDGQNTVSRKNRIDFMAGANITAEAGSRNSVGFISSESASVTLVGDAVLDYAVIDRNNGRRWDTFRYPADQHFKLLLNNGTAVAGTPVIGAIGGGLIPAILFDAASTETWQWILPPDRLVSGGRILGFKLASLKSTATNAGNVLLRLGVIGRSSSQGPTSPVNTEDFVHAVNVAGSGSFTYHTAMLATPLNWGVDNSLIVRASRIGGDASDTYPDDWGLVGLDVIYQSDIANSDPGAYRFMSPPDGQ